MAAGTPRAAIATAGEASEHLRLPATAVTHGAEVAAHASAAAEATPGVEADLTSAEEAAATSAVVEDRISEEAVVTLVAAGTPVAEVMMAAGTVAVIIAKQVV